MSYLTGAAGLAYFLMISAATKQHFVSDKFPIGMYVISAVSLIGLFTFLAHAFVATLNLPVAVLGIIISSSALFVWSIHHSRMKGLSLAFDDAIKIDGIITSGPWSYIRHPFYSSYILFWLACALGTMHPTSIVVLATLTFIYVYSAAQEERALRESEFKHEFICYREKSGFILPKIWQRN